MLFHLSMLKDGLQQLLLSLYHGSIFRAHNRYPILTAGWTGGVFQSEPNPGLEPATFRMVVRVLNHEAKRASYIQWLLKMADYICNKICNGKIIVDSNPIQNFYC